MTAATLSTDRSGGTARLRRIDPVVLVALVLATLLAVVVFGRDGGSGATAAAGAELPSSPAIEDRFGIRLTGAYITADGGMVEITYQVLDADKAVAVHADGNGPVVAFDGTVFDTPGLAGHGHGKQDVAAGRSTFVLLANSAGRLSAGDVVSIHVADLVLDGVTLG